jgi:hypothetical protein
MILFLPLSSIKRCNRYILLGLGMPQLAHLSAGSQQVIERAGRLNATIL